MFLQVQEFFRPYGGECVMDFSQRGGHQKVIVKLPIGEVHRIDIPSSPRNEGAAIDLLRQKCQRIARDSLR